MKQLNKSMGKKNLLLAFLLAFAFMFAVQVSALEDLGSSKVNEVYEFCQVCDDASFITLSSIKTPTTNVLLNANMTSTGSGQFCYNYTPTEIGRYDFKGISDGCEGTFATYTYITMSGEQPAGDNTIVVFSLLFVVIIFFSIIYLFKMLGHLIELQVDLIDTSIMVGAYLAIWIFYYISHQYLGNLVLDDLLVLALKIGAITHVIMPIVSFMISFIMVNLQAKRKAKYTY